MEFVFFCLCIQSHFLESFQYLFNVALVLHNIIRVDQGAIVKPKIYSGLKLTKFCEFTPQETELR